MYNMFNLITVFFVCSGIGLAVHTAYDLKSHKQPMKIMNAVWILTALWGSYLASWAYNKFGRSTHSTDSSQESNMNGNMDMKMDRSMDMSMNDMPMDGNSERPKWQSIALSALHCGAGCTLADIIGEWITHYIPISIGGSLIFGNWVLDYILALIIGVYFQYYAIREMENISVSKGLVRAVKADFFSLTSWQIGMYGWMAIVYFVLFKNAPLEKDSWTFWFMMQIAMLFGFICAYPMNAILIRLGVKKGM